MRQETQRADDTLWVKSVVLLDDVERAARFRARRDGERIILCNTIVQVQLMLHFLRLKAHRERTQIDERVRIFHRLTRPRGRVARERQLCRLFAHVWHPEAKAQAVHDDLTLREPDALRPLPSQHGGLLPCLTISKRNLEALHQRDLLAVLFLAFAPRRDLCDHVPALDCRHCAELAEAALKDRERPGTVEAWRCAPQRLLRGIACGGDISDVRGARVVAQRKALAPRALRFERRLDPPRERGGLAARAALLCARRARARCALGGTQLLLSMVRDERGGGAAHFAVPCAAQARCATALPRAGSQRDCRWALLLQLRRAEQHAVRAHCARGARQPTVDAAVRRWAGGARGLRGSNGGDNGRRH